MDRPVALVARTGFGFGIFMRDVSTAPDFAQHLDAHGGILVSPSVYDNFIFQHGHTHRLISLHALPVCCPGCLPLSVCFLGDADNSIVGHLIASTRFLRGFCSSGHRHMLPGPTTRQ